jgi:hypothetical protein
MESSLQSRVDRALDAAVFENGYRELMGQGADEVTVDLCTYDPEMEDLARASDEAPDEIQRCVQDYMDWYARQGSDGPKAPRVDGDEEEGA